ncbi:hypothetical protein [Thalassovita mangrovi]|uniref:hypothetical protein n=1 Tax=Thalassovita mangrovi TaxID=2692236 RepID=UPI001BB2E092|nr:hypothetical protein [Thalassovita mangrovi]
MSKVVLHIGTHKTATTTIQNRFWAFAPQLEEHGLIYPRLNQITGHHGLVCDWVPLPEVYHLPKGSTETLRDLGKQYGNRDVTVFLSSEEFSRGEPKGGVDYAALRSALSGFDEIEVIAVLRTQWEFMQSVYLELSKNRVPPEPDKLLPPTFKRGLFAGLWADYNLLLDRLEAVFAPEEITLFDFNDCRSAEGGILGRLLTHLGVSVSPETLAEMTAASSNISPLSLASWAANMLSDPDPAPTELVDRMGRVLRQQYGEDVNPCLFTRAEFDRLKTHFDLRNAELAKRRAPVQPGFAITPASAEGVTMFRDDIKGKFWLTAGRSLTTDLMAAQPESEDAPKPATDLPLWRQDSAAITAAIRARPAPFKIVLHTRNDPALSDWVAHHAAIVGYEGLIIADNMSDAPEVLEQLQDLAGRSCVFRFEGDRDALHDRAQYPDLFAAIEASSGWMTMIAADERLIWVEADGSWIADQRILDKLAERGGLSAIPAVLIDSFGSDAGRFVIPRGKKGLTSRLERGKPVIRSGAGVGPGVKCHNTEFEKSLFDPGESAHFIQLHLQDLPPEQTPRTQRESGVYPSATDERASAAAKEAQGAPGLLQRARRKVRRLLNGKAAPTVEDTIRLRPDGTIDGTAAQRARFGELITRSAALLDAMPRSEHPENRQ